MFMSPLGMCYISGYFLTLKGLVCSTKPTAQFSFLSAKEVLWNIICTLDHRQNRTVLIAKCGVAEKMFPIAFKILQDEAGWARVGGIVIADICSPLA